MTPHYLPTEATLDEILFILGEPLREDEVWAILFAASITLIHYFEKSRNAKQIHYLLPAINPDTLLLNLNGTVNFLRKKADNVKEPRPAPLLHFDDKVFVSPENLCSELRKNKLTGDNKIAIEKMFIYSLGMCMLTAVQHSSENQLESLVSLDLQACLTIMIEESVVTRISADSLKKLCLQHMNAKISSTIITKLAKEILGSVETLAGSSSANLTLPNPTDSLDSKKYNDSTLKLPTPKRPLEKKDVLLDDEMLQERLILPLSPNEKLILEAKHQNEYFPSIHIQPLKSLSPLSFSKTNESIESSSSSSKCTELPVTTTSPITSSMVSRSLVSPPIHCERELSLTQSPLLSSTVIASAPTSPVHVKSLTPLSLSETNDTVDSVDTKSLICTQTLVTPSPITPSMITCSEMSPQISNDKELSVTQSPLSSIEVTSAHASPIAVSVSEILRIDESSTLVVSPINYPSLVPAVKELDSIPIAEGVTEKVEPNNSHLSGRRHSVGSYGTVLSSRSISQASLMQGAYSLDKGLVMEPEYPISRFISAGALSHGRGSSASLHFNRYLDGTRRESDLPQLGPEFVRVPSDPETAFIDITAARLGPLPKRIRLISVILLNGQEIQTQVNVFAQGKELFEQIALHIGLKESLYFGFALLENGEHLFIDLDHKLTKYAPLGWKDEGNKKKKAEFVLHFKVKFFIENPRNLKHKLTSHFYYLQLRKAIATGYTHCADEALLLRLAGYALQAEYGDFVTEFSTYEYFHLKHYLPPYLLNRINNNDLYCNLAAIHQTLSGKTRFEAEMCFLDEAKSVDEYGILFHKVSRSKDDPSDTVLLGICIDGIIIKEYKRSRRKLVHTQCWDLIKKFYFEKKQFKVKSKVPEDTKMIFYSSHYKRSKYLFKMCQSFHRFQIFNQPLAKQNLSIKRKGQNTFSEPLGRTAYNSTLKGSQYSNSILNPGETKVNEIKFIPIQNEEGYCERSVDVLNNGNGTVDRENCKNQASKEEKESNLQEEETPLTLSARFDNYEDRILVKCVGVQHSSRNSPRSIYSDDESFYTECDHSANETRLQTPVEGSTRESVISQNPEELTNNEIVANNGLGSDKEEIISDVPSSTLSRQSSEYGQPLNLKRMSGIDNLDRIMTSPDESDINYVESEGLESF